MLFEGIFFIFLITFLFVGNKDFRNSVLRTHNRFRKRHGSAPLKWNSNLASMAERAAQEAAQTNTLRSVDNNQVGQNMAAMVGSELTGDRVSTMWYDEEKNYNYSSGGFSSNTGAYQFSRHTIFLCLSLETIFNLLIRYFSPHS